MPPRLIFYSGKSEELCCYCVIRVSGGLLTMAATLLPPGSTLCHLSELRTTWHHLGTPGITWDHLGSPSTTRHHLGLLGTTWDHQALSGTT